MNNTEYARVKSAGTFLVQMVEFYTYFYYA